MMGISGSLQRALGLLANSVGSLGASSAGGTSYAGAGYCKVR